MSQDSFDGAMLDRKMDTAIEMNNIEADLRRWKPATPWRIGEFEAESPDLEDEPNAIIDVNGECVIYFEAYIGHDLLLAVQHIVYAVNRLAIEDEA